MRILFLNGPNLDLLGTREPHIYGDRSFPELLEELRKRYPQVTFSYVQSNVEGELVSAVRGAVGEFEGIIINPAGYSHTIAWMKVPVVEVHISNIHAREEFRHNTITGAVCAGVITGFGSEGYRLAVEHLLKRG